MAVKEFWVQVRYTCDHPDQFKAGVTVMQQLAAKAYSRLRIGAGPNNPAPQIKVFSDDSMALINSEEDANKLLGVGEESPPQGG